MEGLVLDRSQFLAGRTILASVKWDSEYRLQSLLPQVLLVVKG